MPTATEAQNSEYAPYIQNVLLNESVRGLPVTLWNSTCKVMQLGVHHLIKRCDILQWNAPFSDHNSENFRYEVERKK
jgi:hypothetical protein